MSKLTDEQIEAIYKQETGALIDDSPWALVDFSRAIEAAATEPLLQRIAHLEATASANYGRGHADAHSMLSERIAELEQRNSDLHEDVQRFKKHALNEKAARLELERLLEEASKDAERYRWLRERMIGVDFDWSENGITALAFEMPDGCSFGGSCDKNIDAAMQKDQS